MYRKFGLNVKENNANAIRFDYRGTRAKNNFEFKMHDDQNVVFRMLLKGVTDTGGGWDSGNEWKTLTVRYNDMQDVTGKNREFNFKNVTRFEFAISKDQDSQGVEGEFSVASMSMVPFPDTFLPQPENRIIREFSIDNNPFQPRSDLAHSKATFSFTLNEKAKVWLRIYDLTGASVRRIDAGTLEANVPKEISWDGINHRGHMVRNGLYLYQFTAEGEKSTQRIKNLIGVSR